MKQQKDHEMIGYHVMYGFLFPVVYFTLIFLPGKTKIYFKMLEKYNIDKFLVICTSFLI